MRKITPILSGQSGFLEAPLVRKQTASLKMPHFSRQIWETPAIVSLINASVELVLICQLYTTPTHRIIHQALCTICRWHSGKWQCGGCLHLADGLGLFYRPLTKSSTHRNLIRCSMMR